MRFRPPLPALAALPALVALAACSENAAGPSEPAAVACDPPAATTRAAGSRSVSAAPEPDLGPLFASAAAEFTVPAPLLAAIAHVETGGRMVAGAEEFPGQEPAFGVMALRGERLLRGAALAGVTPEAARTDPASNVRAAAALLRRYAQELGIHDSGEPGAWAPAVARFSGIGSAAGQAAYLRDDVYATLRRAGLLIAVPEFAPAGPVGGALRSSAVAGKAAADFAGAVWRPSPNFNARPAGPAGQIGLVVIHTCEGAYTGCWSWLTNPASGVSAHYVVREDGSEVSQLVAEAQRAWHIAASYDCALNAQFDCARNGTQNNHWSIGIEHGGFAAQSSWPAAQIETSSRLVCDITQRQGIPRDRQHIVGHAQLQPYNRTDPGANWPWADYYARIGSACEPGTTVDGDNPNNDATRGRAEIPAGWTRSASRSGFYGSGYWCAMTVAGSAAGSAAPAAFWFYLAEPGWRTVDAWWPGGPNRTPAASITLWGADGRQRGGVAADQRSGGGQWNALGRWEFPAGWNRVQVERTSAAGGAAGGAAGQVVIADAVRVRS